jgi:WD40 repeat protein
MESPAGWAELKQMMISQAEVAKLAESGRPDVRLDESLFPDANRAVPIQTLHGHAGEVVCLACDPHDEKLLASGSKDGTIRFWDIITGKCLRTIRTIPKHDCIAYNQSKQGELVSASGNKLIRWNTNTGHQIGSAIKAGYVQHLVSNPHDHTQWASSSLKSRLVSLWNLATKEKRQLDSGEDGKVFAMDFDQSTANRLIVASGDGRVSTIRFWDTATGEGTHELTVNHPRPAWHPVLSLKCIKPAQFIVGSMDDNLIEVWDTNRKERIHTFNAKGTTHARELAWNERNPTQIASTNRLNAIQVCNTETGEISLTIKEPEGTHIRCLELCAGRQLAVGLSDRTIRLWKIVRLSPIAAALKAYAQTRDALPEDFKAEFEGLSNTDLIAYWSPLAAGIKTYMKTHDLDIFPAHLEADLNALSYEERESVFKEWSAKFNQ